MYGIETGLTILVHMRPLYTTSPTPSQQILWNVLMAIDQTKTCRIRLVGNVSDRLLITASRIVGHGDRNVKR